jgi:hypothetical protein
MNKVILFLVAILGVLIYLYTSKQENLTESTISDIWQVKETLNVGDIKSSIDGQNKFVVTDNGLEFYNHNLEKFNMYPYLLGSSKKYSKTKVYITTQNNNIGFEINQDDISTFSPFADVFNILQPNNLNKFAYFKLTNENINGYDENNNLILQNY